MDLATLRNQRKKAVFTCAQKIIPRLERWCRLNDAQHGTIFNSSINPYDIMGCTVDLPMSLLECVSASSASTQPNQRFSIHLPIHRFLTKLITYAVYGNTDLVETLDYLKSLEMATRMCVEKTQIILSLIFNFKSSQTSHHFSTTYSTTYSTKYQTTYSTVGIYPIIVRSSIAIHQQNSHLMSPSPLTLTQITLLHLFVSPATYHPSPITYYLGTFSITHFAVCPS